MRREKVPSNVLMMFCWVVFSPVICIIEFSRSPVNPELVLAFPISEPMETHIHGFGAFRLDLTVAHCLCHRVVRLKWGRGLCVSECLEDNSDVYGFSCINV